MTTEENTPSIRFAGYTYAWERRRLGEVCDITTGRLDANAMSPDGEYDFYTCSLQVYKIDKYAFEGPAITVAGNGYVGCLHLADGKFNAYQRTYVLSNFKAVREYLYAEIGNKLPEKVNQEARSGNIPYIVMDMLTDLEISLPYRQEQSYLASFFRALDSLLTLHQRKCEKLQKIKKAMLDKMFPKNGELVPSIRFAGYTYAWERRRLGEVCDITTGRLDANAMSPDGEYDFYTCSLQVYKIDKYAFEGPAITVAGNGYVGCLHLADGKFNAYQRTYVLSNFKAVREYLYAEIGNKLPEKVNQEARSGNIPYIVMDMLTDLEISLPYRQEQSYLASFFRALDSLLTLHQRKCEKLQKIKKAFLEKMFV